MPAFVNSIRRLFNGNYALITNSVGAQYVYDCLSGLLCSDLSGPVINRHDSFISDQITEQAAVCAVIDILP
jgi:hypothetical protein